MCYWPGEPERRLITEKFLVSSEVMSATCFRFEGLIRAHFESEICPKASQNKKILEILLHPARSMGPVRIILQKLHYLGNRRWDKLSEAKIEAIAETCHEWQCTGALFTWMRCLVENFARRRTLDLEGPNPTDFKSLAVAALLMYDQKLLQSIVLEAAFIFNKKDGQMFLDRLIDRTRLASQEYQIGIMELKLSATVLPRKG
jgi:hypothetical protein